jgi:hypothetical protein
MATKPDAFPALAMKRATSSEVSALFCQLAERASTLAQMQDEFLETIIQHSEQRTGKKFNYTKRQQKFLGEFDRDADDATRQIEKSVQKMDDPTLLTSAFSGEQMQLNQELKSFPTYRSEDQSKAQEIINFRRETLNLIEQFIRQSEFKDKVNSALQMLGLTLLT